MLALGIVCIIVLPVLALVFYVVTRSRPTRFRINATVLKLVSFNIEVDSQDKPAARAERPASGSGELSQT